MRSGYWHTSRFEHGADLAQSIGTQEVARLSAYEHCCVPDSSTCLAVGAYGCGRLDTEDMSLGEGDCGMGLCGSPGVFASRGGTHAAATVPSELATSTIRWSDGNAPREGNNCCSGGRDYTWSK